MVAILNIFPPKRKRIAEPLEPTQLIQLAMSENAWQIAMVHSYDPSKVLFTATVPSLPPGGTVLSHPHHSTVIKFVVVRCHLEIPDTENNFPSCNRTFVEVRDISLDRDFPTDWP